MAETNGLLINKTAVIYGAGGSIGSQVARAFAGEGARVFAVGRSAAPLAALMEDAGPQPRSIAVQTVDARDAAAIEDHLEQVHESAGRIDISFNLIGVDDVQGQPLVEMSAADYMRPIEIGLASHFLTGTAAAKRMAANGTGVIMALTATPSRLALPLVGGFGTYCGGVEAFYRTLAAKVGEKGVRGRLDPLRRIVGDVRRRRRGRLQRRGRGTCRSGISGGPAQKHPSQAISTRRGDWRPGGATRIESGLANDRGRGQRHLRPHRRLTPQVGAHSRDEARLE